MSLNYFICFNIFLVFFFFFKVLKKLKNKEDKIKIITYLTLICGTYAVKTFVPLIVPKARSESVHTLAISRF